MTLKARARRVVAPLLDILDRRFENLARLITIESTALQASLDAKATELHESIHTKSTELHESLHTKSAELHASLNALHGRMARLEAAVAAVLDLRPFERLIQAEVPKIRSDLDRLHQRLADVDERVATELRGLLQNSVTSQETHLESLAYVGRTLREIRDRAAHMSLEPEAHDHERDPTPGAP